MKKIALIFLIIGVVAISAYVFVRKTLATPHFTPPKTGDTSLQTAGRQSVLDLKPKLIEKMQQLVKQGSGGLYNLFIHQVNPDILKSTVGISKIALIPDTAAMKQLESNGQLPTEIFKIKTDSVWIDGLGVKDILSKDVVDLKTIHILHPTIEIFSKGQTSGKKDEKTLYQRLMKEMKHIGIGNIIIEGGTLVSHNLKKNKTVQLNDISIHLSDILIDSSTQFDKSRFLFAKQALLSMKDYSVPSANHLYRFNIGSISVNASQHTLAAKNISLQPLYSKDEFQNHIKNMKERYEISIPSIELRGADWWQLVNEENIIASSAQIEKAQFNVYLDRRRPSGPTDMKSFPHQMIMKLPIKIHINKLTVGDLDVVYEEFNKASGEKGKLEITGMRGTITNLTNMPQVIRSNRYMLVQASGMLMHIAPAELSLRFDLANYQAGNFSAGLSINKDFDGTLVNPVAEPLGMFLVKRGNFRKLDSHISGNNFGASGTVLFLYDNLHVTPLERNKNGEGLNKKNFTSFLGNALLIRDQNPVKNGEEKSAPGSFQRHSGTFFNLIWKTTFTGILKTTGAPQKLANQ